MEFGAEFKRTNRRVTTHHHLHQNPVNFTCGLLSAAKTIASFQNRPQAIKMIFKARVEFVMIS